MNNADRAAELLQHEPMTRYELECRLGTSQQRACEIIRAVGAQVVGYAQPPKQGRPAPIYALVDVEPEAKPERRLAIGRVSSVWQLGAV
jgi:predicted ArsR family transcriptional regulator